MNTIIISPYSQTLRNGKRNPKNYPYWQEVIDMLKRKGFLITQTGRGNEAHLQNVDEFLFDKSLKELRKAIQVCYTWASVDNFFPHLAASENKPGVVVWGRSDPRIFGYKQNKNLVKNIGYLRDKQWDIWEAVEYDKKVFVGPEEVVNAIVNRPIDI
jgi:hypothetical protein